MHQIGASLGSLHVTINCIHKYLLYLQACKLQDICDYDSQKFATCKANTLQLLQGISIASNAVQNTSGISKAVEIQGISLAIN
jgi:hypothetical protein